MLTKPQGIPSNSFHVIASRESSEDSSYEYDSEFVDDFVLYFRSNKLLDQSDLESSGYCDSLRDSIRCVELDGFYLEGQTFDPRDPLADLAVDPSFEREQVLRMSYEDAAMFELIGEWIVSDRNDMEFTVEFRSMSISVDGSEVDVNVFVSRC